MPKLVDIQPPVGILFDNDFCTLTNNSGADLAEGAVQVIDPTAVAGTVSRPIWYRTRNCTSGVLANGLKDDDHIDGIACVATRAIVNGQDGQFQLSGKCYARVQVANGGVIIVGHRLILSLTGAYLAMSTGTIGGAGRTKVVAKALQAYTNSTGATVVALIQVEMNGVDGYTNFAG